MTPVEMFGINTSLLIVQLFNFAIVGGWLVLGGLALFSLRPRPLSDTARVLWAVLIVAVPILGALAYWIVRPDGATGPGGNEER